MNKLNQASKRELNPFWIFFTFLCKGRCISLGSFVVMRNYGLPCGVLFGSCTDREGLLLLCKSSLLQNKDSRGGFAETSL